ncbi:MAG: hypothetical protein ACT4TC_02620 [Myxococcaceae bacterium]
MADSPITPPARVFYFGPSSSRPTGTVPVEQTRSMDAAQEAARTRGVFVVRPSDAEIQANLLRRGIQSVASRSVTEPVVTGESIFRALATEGITPKNNLPFTDLFAARVCQELTGDDSLNITPEQLWELALALRENELPKMPIAALLALADQLESDSHAPKVSLEEWLGFTPEATRPADLRELLRELTRDLRVAAVKLLASELPPAQ